MASSKPPKGRRTSTGAREVHVTVTRDRHGRRQVRDTVSGRYASVAKEGRRQAELVDRVDQRLRFGRQTDGWWFIPPRAGGTHNWVPQQKRPTIIRGYLYRPGSPWPRSTDQNPGPLDRKGRPEIPAGTVLTSAVPRDVWLAGTMFNRSTEPSTKHETFKARRTRATEGYTDRYRVTKPKKR